jgi:hypothetical protein
MRPRSLGSRHPTPAWVLILCLAATACLASPQRSAARSNASTAGAIRKAVFVNFQLMLNADKTTRQCYGCPDSAQLQSTFGLAALRRFTELVQSRHSGELESGAASSSDHLDRMMFSLRAASSIRCNETREKYNWRQMAPGSDKGSDRGVCRWFPEGGSVWPMMSTRHLARPMTSTYFADLKRAGSKRDGR